MKDLQPKILLKHFLKFLFLERQKGLLQGKILQTQRKNYAHRILCKSMARQDNFIPENIFLYSPQRDRALSTSKKKIRNNGNRQLA